MPMHVDAKSNESQWCEKLFFTKEANSDVFPSITGTLLGIGNITSWEYGICTKYLLGIIFNALGRTIKCPLLGRLRVHSAMEGQQGHLPWFKFHQHRVNQNDETLQPA